jgi:hypothetical protein
MIRNKETTRLEIVSRVRLLFRRIFLKINFAYFIKPHLWGVPDSRGMYLNISEYALWTERFIET